MCVYVCIMYGSFSPLVTSVWSVCVSVGVCECVKVCQYNVCIQYVYVCECVYVCAYRVCVCIIYGNFSPLVISVWSRRVSMGACKCAKVSVDENSHSAFCQSYDQKSPHQQWLMSINTHMMRAYSSKEPCIHSKEMFNQTRCSVKRVLSTVFWYDKHRQTDKSHDANLDQKSSRFHQ